MLLGTYGKQWRLVQADIGGLNVYLEYNNTNQGPNGIPLQWPGGQCLNDGPIPNGAIPFICFKPTDVAGLIAGTYDATLIQYLKGSPGLPGAPAGSWVAPWQEGNDAGSGYANTPAQFGQMALHMKQLCSDFGIPVKIMQKFGSFPVISGAQDLTQWVVPGVDLYGIDVYGIASHPTPQSAAQPLVSAIRSVYPNAQIGITETGPSTESINFNRMDWSSWLNAMYEYAVTENLFCVMPYFSGDLGDNDYTLLDVKNILRKLAVLAPQASLGNG